MEGQKTKYAPIVVFVYDRLSHLQECVLHLKRNRLASESELFIVSDAAKNDAAALIVRAIRDYVATIDGFLSVNLIAREINVGSFNSVVLAYNEIFLENDRLIALEDDVMVSESFLEYINKGLQYFETDPRCFAMCGYFYPVEVPQKYKYDFVKLPHIFSAWGYGIWRNKWMDKQFTTKAMDNYMTDHKGRSYFRKHFGAIEKIMLDFYHVDKIPMDTVIIYQMYLRKEYAVFPKNNLTVNIGFDGSGENCSEDLRFSSQNLNRLNDITFLKNINYSKKIRHNLSMLSNSLGNQNKIPANNFIALLKYLKIHTAIKRNAPWVMRYRNVILKRK